VRLWAQCDASGLCSKIWDSNWVLVLALQCLSGRSCECTAGSRASLTVEFHNLVAKQVLGLLCAIVRTTWHRACCRLEIISVSRNSERAVEDLTRRFEVHDIFLGFDRSGAEISAGTPALQNALKSFSSSFTFSKTSDHLYKCIKRSFFKVSPKLCRRLLPIIISCHTSPSAHFLRRMAPALWAASFTEQAGVPPLFVLYHLSTFVSNSAKMHHQPMTWITCTVIEILPLHAASF
jgi:hypothetical protein